MNSQQLAQVAREEGRWYALLTELDPIDVLILEGVYQRGLYASRFIKERLPRQSPRTVERRIHRLADLDLLTLVGQRPLVVSPILKDESNVAILCREVRKLYGVTTHGA